MEKQIKSSNWLIKGYTEQELAEIKEKAIKEAEAELRDKQIEEMAKDLETTHDSEGCEAWHCGGCEYEKYGKHYFCSSIKQAEKLTSKGYCKASDVAREILGHIESFFHEDDFGDLTIDFMVFQELKKKYESEGE